MPEKFASPVLDFVAEPIAEQFRVELTMTEEVIAEIDEGFNR